MDVEELYRHHRETLLVFFARRTADPQIALDLWAETFAQALAGAHRFRGRTAPERQAWLYAIAQRQLAQYYRRGSIEQRALRRLKLERPVSSPELLAQIEQRAGLGAIRDELAAALSRLSPSLREAVQLRVVGELSYGDVAGQLGISEGAARVRVSRGLAVLADLLAATPTETVTP
jgi:RNA polymerase sigma-70 factor, ECF subfamily